VGIFPAIRKKSLLGTIIVVLLFQLYSRYAAAPATDFVSDGWSSLSIAQQAKSYAAIFSLAAKEADRPLTQAAIPATFRFLGDRPALFALLSALVFSLALLTAMAMVYLLTDSCLGALLFGIIFSVVPNLTESFYWAHQVPIAYMLWAYVACGLFWLLFLKHHKPIFLVLSAAAYALGLFSYEVGVLIPVSFLVLNSTISRRKMAAAMLPFAGALGLYLLWRLGLLFGVKSHIVNGRDYLAGSWSPGIAYWNVKQILSWWVDGHMINCLRNGFNGFAEMGKRTQRFLFLGDVAAVVLLARLIRHQAAESRPVPTVEAGRVIIFGLAWAIMGHSTNLISWTAGRLNYLPAIGVSIACAGLLMCCKADKWMPYFGTLVFVCLLGVQGTAFQWREAGAFQRKLYDFVKAHQADWSTSSIVCFETAALRQRLTPDLFPVREDSSAWACYGNAGLLRGFAVNAMLRLAKPGGPGPEGILDVECGAHVEGDDLVWHERYDPGKPHKTSMAHVYVVDCLAAGSGQAK